MTLDQIFGVENDISSLSRRELAKQVTTAARSLNKRIRNIEKADISPEYKRAVYNITKSASGEYQLTEIKPFSARGKNLNELRAEISRMRAFKGSMTSTVKGTKEYQKRTSQYYEQFFPGYNNKSFQERMEDATRFWKSVRQLIENNPQYDSEYIARLMMMANEFGLVPEEIIDKVQSEIERMQADEEREAREEEFYTDPFTNIH